MEHNKPSPNEGLLYKDEVYAVIGAAIEVHKELGNGFLESVYEEALKIELADKDIPYLSQVRLPVYYKGKQLPKEFVVDGLAYQRILIELKCVPQLTHIEEAQILHYLKASGFELGLLINFGATSRLEWKRFVRSSHHKNLSDTSRS
jgi:GxxExxY protein